MLTFGLSESTPLYPPLESRCHTWGAWIKFRRVMWTGCWIILGTSLLAEAFCHTPLHSSRFHCQHSLPYIGFHGDIACDKGFHPQFHQLMANCHNGIYFEKQQNHRVVLQVSSQFGIYIMPIIELFATTLCAKLYKRPLIPIETSWNVLCMICPLLIRTRIS